MAASMPHIQEATRQMQRQGIRRLMVLSGDPGWSSQQAAVLAAALPGDWLWVGRAPERPVHCVPSAVRARLGSEYQHAIFDAREGVDASALAALSGMLKAGSWLLLLAPEWSTWASRPDADSVRWSDAPQAIPTPHFISHLQHCVLDDAEVVLWQQARPLALPRGMPRPDWQPAHGAPEKEQAAILAAIRAMGSGVAVVTAARGRGKSALAGMLVQRVPGMCVVTAPAKTSTTVLASYAGDRFQFVAPDALAADAGLAHGDWLVVDEAAGIPAPLLRRLIGRFPHVLLTTTVQGYEGTGRGFLLKFCASLPHVKRFSLTAPIRWAQNDPLERVVNKIMLFDEPDLAQPSRGKVELASVEPVGGGQQSDRVAPIYRLLSGAHYRTSPLDWRRMLDAPGQHIMAASVGAECIGALWLVEEGGLNADLSRCVWAGFRRPRGNLVAQSLAAHGGNPEAATLLGLRVSRIAVHPLRQREGIGSRLLTQARIFAAGRCDYLSVSFGYTDELWQFWQSGGFELVRIGSHKEASSGCYTAMALLPLSAEGRALADREKRRLARDWPWIQPWVDLNLALAVEPVSGLVSEDLDELAGFAFAHRPLEACLGALNRVLRVCDLPLAVLRGCLQQGERREDLGPRLGFSGKKAVLAAMRQEAAQALENVAPTRSDALRNHVLQLQKFH